MPTTTAVPTAMSGKASTIRAARSFSRPRSPTPASEAEREFRAEHEGQIQGAPAPLDRTPHGSGAPGAAAAGCPRPIRQCERPGNHRPSLAFAARDRRSDEQGAAAVLRGEPVPAAVAQRIRPPLGRGLDAYASLADRAVRRG